MNKDSLIVKLMRDKGWSLAEAEEFVADMPDEPEPESQSARRRGGWQAGDAVQVRSGGGSGERAIAPRFIVAQRNPDGTTARQAAALDRGVSLCPNCQQGEDDHVPGCFRDPRNGFDDRSRQRTKTTGQLPPIS